VVFLTIDNILHGQAIYGNGSKTYVLKGWGSIVVNLGILLMVFSFLAYLLYVYRRTELLFKYYYRFGVSSALLIGGGLVLDLL